jgi:hypothetical protein
MSMGSAQYGTFAFGRHIVSNRFRGSFALFHIQQPRIIQRPCIVEKWPRAFNETSVVIAGKGQKNSQITGKKGQDRRPRRLDSSALFGMSRPSTEEWFRPP